MAKTVATRTIDLEPIDRLEEKLKMLVGMIERLRAESARHLEDNAQLSRELDALRARLTDVEGATAEVTALREERDLIRSRVTEMLQQLDTLDL